MDLRQFNIVQECYSACLTAILCIYLLLATEKKRKSDRLFIYTLLFNILSLFGAMSDWVFSGVNTSSAGLMLNLGSCLSFVATSSLILCFYLYLVSILEDKVVVPKIFTRIVVSLYMLNTLLCLLSLRFGLYYFVNDAGYYERGKLFFLSVGYSIIAYLLIIYFLYRYRSVLSRGDVGFLSSFMIFPWIAEILQIVYYGIDFLTLGVTLSLMLVFIRMQLEYKSNTKMEKAKLAAESAQQTLEMLASAIDAKDPYTKGHAFRVSVYSEILANELGWPADRVEKLRSAALLHDIGKIGVPDNILNKPSKLTAVEFDIIKSHTVSGHEILSASPSAKDAADVALYHHERYDGKGYPKGIVGKEIPEEARLVCIADSFDAMNSRRIYRSALTKDQIMSELIKGRGTQFDPVYLDAFVDLYRLGKLDTVFDERKKMQNGSDAELVDNIVGFMQTIAQTPSESTPKSFGAPGILSVAYEDVDTVLMYLHSLQSRYNHSFHVAEIDIISDADAFSAAKDIVAAMDYMSLALMQSLRSVDICTKNSSHSYLLILLDANRDNLSKIIERVFRSFYRMYNGASVHLNYRFVDLEEEDIHH